MSRRRVRGGEFCHLVGPLHPLTVGLLDRPTSVVLRPLGLTWSAGMHVRLVGNDGLTRDRDPPSSTTFSESPMESIGCGGVGQV